MFPIVHAAVRSQISDLRFQIWLAIAALAVAAPLEAGAQERVGGHVGAVVPIVTRTQSQTVTIADDFVIGFPTGITINATPRVAFDLELVPVIQNGPLDVRLTIHPGIIYSAANRMAAGVRMAFDVDSPSFGFTPLVKRTFGAAGSPARLFIEADVPIRFQENFRGENFVSIGVGTHVGVAF
jgi:hypothetical protein